MLEFGKKQEAFRALPGMVFAPEVDRAALVAHIKGQLGEQLGALYADSIQSSVETGCYDIEWAAGELPLMRIDRYVQTLRRDWINHKGDKAMWLDRLFWLQDFGTDEEKAALRQLGLMP